MTWSFSRNFLMAGWPMVSSFFRSIVRLRFGSPSSPTVSLMVTKSLPASRITFQIIEEHFKVKLDWMCKKVKMVQAEVAEAVQHITLLYNRLMHNQDQIARASEGARGREREKASERESYSKFDWVSCKKWRINNFHLKSMGVKKTHVLLIRLKSKLANFLVLQLWRDY